MKFRLGIFMDKGRHPLAKLALAFPLMGLAWGQSVPSLDIASSTLGQSLYRPAAIEAFRFAGQPEFTSVPQGAAIHVVDALELNSQRLSAGLPADPQKAVEMARARLQALTDQDKNLLRQSATSLARAGALKLQKVPAVVFDGTAIVYGVSDVAQAQEIYRAWRSRNPQSGASR